MSDQDHTDPFGLPENTADLDAIFNAGPNGKDAESVGAAKIKAEEAAKAAKKAKATGGSPSKKQLAPGAANALRQGVVKILQALSPADYEKYKAIKFEGVAPGVRPTLEQSKKAYMFAFEKFLDVTYTKSGV